MHRSQELIDRMDTLSQRLQEGLPANDAFHDLLDILEFCLSTTSDESLRLPTVLDTGIRNPVSPQA